MKQDGKYKFITDEEEINTEMTEEAHVCSDGAIVGPEDMMMMLDFSNRVIWMYDEITPENSVAMIRKIIQWNRDDYNMPVEDRQPIYLYINCGGGEISSSFALCDTILASKTPVYGVNIGYAFSGAFYTLLACHKRFGTKRSWYMMHRGSGTSVGADHLSAHNSMKQWDCQIAEMTSYITERTNIPKAVVENYMLTDSYFNSADAVTVGIIDKVIESIDELIPEDYAEN